MKLSDQWEAINKARRTLPVDVEQLAETLGVKLQKAYLGPGLSGVLERNGEEFRITINADDPLTRQRFTLAHELGHYMLHRHLIGDGVDDDRAYRSTVGGKYYNIRIGPEQETEANKFAATLLMPKPMIEHVRSIGASVGDMATQFGVSEHAMSSRLGVPY